MGMLKKAKELEAKNPNSVVFLDFSDRDFDSSVVMTPSTVDSTLWRKFLDLSFGDLANLIAPETVVFCEGGIEKGKRQNFDATIYRTIFTNNHPLTEFVSIGSCSDVEDPNNTSMRIVNALLSHSHIIKLVDRDDKSDKEKRTNVVYLVQAKSLARALRYIDEVMGKTMIDYDTIGINETPIMDVFEHQVASEKKEEKNDVPEYEQENK